MNPKMIVAMASDKRVKHALATVAKDEKIRLPSIVYAKNRYKDNIWYDESENHPLDEYYSFLLFLNNGRTMCHCFPSALFLLSANPRWGPRRRTHARERQHFFRQHFLFSANPRWRTHARERLHFFCS